MNTQRWCGSLFFTFALVLAAIAVVCLPSSCLAQGAPTVTTLSISPSANVSPGTIVRITASVTSSGAAVYPGQVLFCDADAPHCTDIAILGMAQLTASGHAVIRMRFGIGKHNIKAFFRGTTRTAAAIPDAAPRQPSTSAPQVVTVEPAGTVPTATTLTASGHSGPFQFTSTVTTPARPVAGGTLTFLDLSNGDIALGAMPLSAGSSSLQLTPKSSPGGSSQIAQSVSGDFNNDGIPDLALSYYGQNFLTILLGKGDGTFTAEPNLPVGLSEGGGMVVADFNGDGIPDIAASVYADTTGNACCVVSILLGKGDGTFTLQSSFPVGDENWQLLAEDFNGDGIVDLAVVNAQDRTVTIALGNGDGSFTTSTTLMPYTGQAGYFPYSPSLLTSGDFNGDGIPDLALAVGLQYRQGSLNVFFGVGDGTFTSTTIPIGLGNLSSVATADFNRDGLPDLAVYDGFYSVTTLLGDGKGGFSALAPLSLQNSGGSLTVGDFNGDGLADLAMGGVQNAIPILFGKGNGQFSEANSFVQTNYFAIQTLSVADFNGDGIPDFAANVLLQNSTEVLLSTPATTVSLTSSPPSGGTHQIEASYSGDSLYRPSVSTPVNVQSVTAVPQVFPAYGNFLSPVKITITDATPGASIYYTINPYATPPGTPTLYTGPFEFPIGTSSENYLIAMATAPGYLPSQQTFDYYYLAAPTQTALYLNTGASVQAGDRVTLAARVTSNGIPFRAGIVHFCNAQAAHCEDSALLGSAAVGPGGWAEVRLRLGVGVYSVRADFLGTTAGPPYAASSSAPQSLVVKGRSATTTTAVLAAVSGGTYQFTSRVAVFGREPIDGALTFKDSVNGGAAVPLGSTELSPANTVLGFAAAAPTLAGSNPLSLAVADFNKDGIPDLVTANTGENTLSILQGRGDGTFTLLSKIPVAAPPTSVATGDMNGDGIADIVVTFRSIDTVTVLLGKADGTFVQSSTLGTPSSPADTLVADLNGDGVLDVATADTESGLVSIFYGNGDGTFLSYFAEVFDFSVPGRPVSLAAADFNGDGILDLVTSNADGTVSILLGTGSAYAAPTSVLAFNPGGSGRIVVGDFNGDGIPDIAVPGSSGIAVYLNNGQGSFAPKHTIPAADVMDFDVADFSGDGVPDIAVTEKVGNQVEVVVYFGAGDGTFPRSTTPKPTQFPESTVVADFNGDGIPDIAASNVAHSVDVLLGAQVTTGAIHGIALPIAGTHAINAAYPGSSTLGPSVGPPVTLVIEPPNP